uniref:uncharacterized protein LOC122609684 n=1 Tax=Erigeron canadensis TaxID=72917 RepID=UPI001CB8D650|nr:uncharacterized protein LOC122609684 [Erigeron canadensis]
MLKSDELDIVKRGGRSRFPLIRLSGLAVSSNSHRNTTSSRNIGGGSIVTLGLQQKFHDIKEIEPKMLDFVHSCIGEAVKRIEEVLNKAAARTFSLRSPRFNIKPTRGSARGVTAQTDQLDGGSLGFN